MSTPTAKTPQTVRVITASEPKGSLRFGGSGYVDPVRLREKVREAKLRREEWFENLCDQAWDS